MMWIFEFLIRILKLILISETSFFFFKLVMLGWRPEPHTWGSSTLPRHFTYLAQFILLLPVIKQQTFIFTINSKKKKKKECVLFASEWKAPAFQGWSAGLLCDLGLSRSCADLVTHRTWQQPGSCFVPQPVWMIFSFWHWLVIPRLLPGGKGAEERMSLPSWLHWAGLSRRLAQQVLDDPSQPATCLPLASLV